MTDNGPGMSEAVLARALPAVLPRSRGARAAGPRAGPGDHQAAGGGARRHARASGARRAAGTTATVRFPSVDRPRADAARAGAARVARGAGLGAMSLPGILVVDDDPHARDLLRRLLGPLGQVSEAAIARRRAEELLKGAVPVDVVLTDMAMPDPDDGLRVLSAAQARHARTRRSSCSPRSATSRARWTPSRRAPSTTCPSPSTWTPSSGWCGARSSSGGWSRRTRASAQQVKQHDAGGAEPGAARGLQAGGARGGDQRAGAHHRRDRHRQGAGGAHRSTSARRARGGRSSRWTAAPSPSR